MRLAGVRHGWNTVLPAERIVSASCAVYFGAAPLGFFLTGEATINASSASLHGRLLAASSAGNTAAGRAKSSCCSRCDAAAQVSSSSSRRRHRRPISLVVRGVLNLTLWRTIARSLVCCTACRRVLMVSTSTVGVAPLPGQAASRRGSSTLASLRSSGIISILISFTLGQLMKHRTNHLLDGRTKGTTSTFSLA